MRSHTVERVEITPVAFADPPLLNSVGVHEPCALRAVVQVHTSSGLVGLGETYGDAAHLSMLERAAEAVVGASPYDVGRLWAVIGDALAGRNAAAHADPTGTALTGKMLGSVVAPFDSAFYDLQGKIIGEPVWALLGGKHRDTVDFSAYLFYKWAAHPGAEPDAWGAALKPDEIVAQARRMVEMYGFRSLKLKGGVFPPDDEAAAVEALHAAFPDHPLRIDPNGAWTVETGTRIARRLGPVLEYLEDPVPGTGAMAQVAAQTSVPLATNMCVVENGHIPEAIRQAAVQIILADQHYWGGFLASMHLASLCRVFGIGVSMHSNSHLGISLAGMVHLGAAVQNIDYALDTHWPWKREDDDVVDTAHLTIRGGAIAVCDRPGLGVELDADRLARMHETYLATEIRTRDDTGYMRRLRPDYEYICPRW
ncbi:enolase C-terminal domain-like protein [Phytoactinopolyspora halotolerans]|uniref:glucarate dehydratase n=1 Tax=Phytoactinopolyspora halotolerans TaxID=1981512 RepID=A0A6L9SB55_9ACTN|nr:enolase C-terminal domain-like protein [Phytoactinopolyspora halotolerans]NEE01230.1 glucarate dehydratase [Phytoactinopolyspora halotolerans]